jgi:LAO/AO transport system kinase
MPAKSHPAKSFNLKHFRDGLLRSDRIVLGRAITLAESNRAQDRANSEKLVEEILPQTGKSIRIGITGAPGVGKSTFIEAFGKYLTSLGLKLAVLTVDPTSQKTKGSILGDKTRMDELSKDPMAFIRPTAAGTAAGGVATTTRASILLCEAAGYEVIVVETVGVGQSEVAVRGMVDFFLLLMLAGAGDELQGIKKGIMEMADGIVITKAEGDNINKAKQAQANFQHALHLFQAPESGWLPHVLAASALAKTGIKEIWQMIELFRVHATHNGFFEAQRRRQQIEWFYAALNALIKDKILNQSKGRMSFIEKQILGNQLSPNKAAREVMKKMKL